MTFPFQKSSGTLVISTCIILHFHNPVAIHLYIVHVPYLKKTTFMVHPIELKNWISFLKYINKAILKRRNFEPFLKGRASYRCCKDLDSGIRNFDTHSCLPPPPPPTHYYASRQRNDISALSTLYIPYT